MRNEHHGALVVGEKSLEPLNGFNVQVVGGLVQQQEIRLPHKCAGQQDTAAPATRQRVDDSFR